MDISSDKFLKSECEEKLERLPCHFNWSLHPRKTFPNDLKFQQWKTDEYIEHSPKDANQSKLLLSYGYTIGDSNGPNFSKAMEHCAAVLNEPNKSEAEHLVALCNEVFIKWKCGTHSEEECLQLLSKINEVEQRLQPKDKAEIRLIKIHAMQMLITDDYGGAFKKCLDEYEQVIKEFSFCNEAVLGAVKMLGKIRRDRGPYFPPKVEEIQYIRKCKRTLPDHPYPFVYDALANLHQLFMRKSSLCTHEYSEMSDHLQKFTGIARKIEASIDKAIQNSNNSASGDHASVLKWCAKGLKAICIASKKYKRSPYKYMDSPDLNALFKHYVTKYDKTIHEAHSMRPDEPGILHEFAIYYMRWALDRQKPKPETIQKMKKLLSESSSNYNSGNIWADLDYAELLTKYGNGDLVELLNELLIKYPKDKEHGNICFRLGLELENRNQLRRAKTLQMCALERCDEYKSGDDIFKNQITKALTSAIQKHKEIVSNSSPRESYLIGTAFLKLQEHREAIEVFKGSLNSNPTDHELRNATCLKLANTLLNDQQYQDAIKAIKHIDELQNTDEGKTILSTAYLLEGDRLKHEAIHLNPPVEIGEIPEYLRKYHRSAIHGQGREKEHFCAEMLKFLSRINTEFEHAQDNIFSLPQIIYELFAALEEKAEDKKEDLITIGLPRVYGSNIPALLYELRSFRYDMTRYECKIDLMDKYKQNLASTIITSMFNLDRSFTEFIRSYYIYHGDWEIIPKKTTFPYLTPQPKDNMAKYGNESKTDLDTAIARIEQRLKSEMKIKCDLPRDVLQYIAKHSQFYNTKHSFIKELSDKTNVHKHRTIITRRLEEQELHEMYNYAHRVADLSERIVATLGKYSERYGFPFFHLYDALHSDDSDSYEFPFIHLYDALQSDDLTV